MTREGVSPIIVLALCWAGNVNFKVAFSVQVCKLVQASCWVIPMEIVEFPWDLGGGVAIPLKANKTGLTR